MNYDQISRALEEVYMWLTHNKGSASYNELSSMYKEAHNMWKAFNRLSRNETCMLIDLIHQMDARISDIVYMEQRNNGGSNFRHNGNINYGGGGINTHGKGYPTNNYGGHHAPSYGYVGKNNGGNNRGMQPRDPVVPSTNWFPPGQQPGKPHNPYTSEHKPKRVEPTLTVFDYTADVYTKGIPWLFSDELPLPVIEKQDKYEVISDKEAGTVNVKVKSNSIDKMLAHNLNRMPTKQDYKEFDIDKQRLKAITNYNNSVDTKTVFTDVITKAINPFIVKGIDRKKLGEYMHDDDVLTNVFQYLNTIMCDDLNAIILKSINATTLFSFRLIDKITEMSDMKELIDLVAKQHDMENHIVSNQYGTHLVSDLRNIFSKVEDNGISYRGYKSNILYVPIVGNETLYDMLKDITYKRISKDITTSLYDYIETVSDNKPLRILLDDFSTLKTLVIRATGEKGMVVIDINLLP